MHIVLLRVSIACMQKRKIQTIINSQREINRNFEFRSVLLWNFHSNIWKYQLKIKKLEWKFQCKTRRNSNILFHKKGKSKKSFKVRIN